MNDENISNPWLRELLTEIRSDLRQVNHKIDEIQTDMISKKVFDVSINKIENKIEDIEDGQAAQVLDITDHNKFIESFRWGFRAVLLAVLGIGATIVSSFVHVDLNPNNANTPNTAIHSTSKDLKVIEHDQVDVTSSAHHH